VESWSHATQGPTGQHLLKTGIDVIHTSYAGHRSSAPVSVLREDGTLSRRLTYAGASSSRVRGTDLALFVQDRWQPSPAWLVDVGGRVDRDGVLDDTNVTVRAGFVRAIGTSGGGAIRGGAGRFYERTPLVVDAFSEFETVKEERFARDGTPQFVPAARLVPTQSGRLHTPRSFIWSGGYTQRLTPAVWLTLNVLSRHGSHEFIVEPRLGAGALVLSDHGRSNYREAEIALRYSPNAAFEAQASYTASRARSDSNAITDFYGAIPSPIVGPNDYAPSPGDTPHRLIARLRWAPGSVWRFGSSLEWRSGFPYDALDEFHDPVTPRLSNRMPPVSRLDLGIDRRIRVRKSRAWIALRVSNVFNTRDPSEVQRRVDSPDFGATFNSRPRQFRLLLRFQ
jgi:outer membrane receptor protein involved in Fe transport